MTYSVFLAIILLLIAFVLGCVVGARLRHSRGDAALVGGDTVSDAPGKAVTAATAAPSVAADAPTSDTRATGSAPAASSPTPSSPAPSSPAPSSLADVTGEATTTAAVAKSTDTPDTPPAADTGPDVETASVTDTTKPAAADVEVSSEPASEEVDETEGTDKTDETGQSDPMPRSAPSGGEAGPSDGNADASAEADASGKRPTALDAPRGGAPDVLTRVKGIGPVNEKRLHGLGIYHFDQIAAWGPSEIAWIDAYLTFKGRVERENWVGQAAELAKDSA